MRSLSVADVSSASATLETSRQSRAMRNTPEARQRPSKRARIFPVYPPEVLARRDQLPKKPAPVVLRGDRVLLEPLVVDRDAEALFAISRDDETWRYMSGGPFANADELRAWLAPQ